jgi:hypothetical protein
MSKVKCFACHKTGHYASQCPNKKKGKKETQVATSTSTKINDFAEKFEKEFSLVSCLSDSGSAVFGDIGAWVVDSGSSRHMMRMRSMFLSVSETDLDNHVGCGTSTMHAVKGVGCVRFQLELGGSLEVAKVLFVPELKVSLLSVSTLEDEGYGVVFQIVDMCSYIQRELPWMQQQCLVSDIERLYNLLGQPVCESKGILDSGSMSVTGGCEATSNTVKSLSWYEMTQLDSQECEETPKGMVRRNRSSTHDLVQVAGKLFGSKGATTTTNGVMGLETDPGGGSRSTFLAKREC